MGKSRQLWAIGGFATGASAALHVGGYLAGGAIGFAVAHGIFIVCKWGGILYFGADAAEHYWDDLSRVANFSAKSGFRKCCLCGLKNSKVGGERSTLLLVVLMEHVGRAYRSIF